jgi:hypothetical protein
MLLYVKLFKKKHIARAKKPYQGNRNSKTYRLKLNSDLLQALDDFLNQPVRR